jgi:hypothetical protein
MDSTHRWRRDHMMLLKVCVPLYKSLCFEAILDRQGETDMKFFVTQKVFLLCYLWVINDF